ncbi:MAG: cysteine--tRNA ligase [Candidatus Diapherotrites archaeon]
MIQVYNTLTRKKDKFKPIKGKEVGMYVCGPTVYGPGHIGHAKTYVSFDIIRRYLEYRGYKVTYVVNITDIHDDIIKKANEQGTTIFELADKNIELFFKDLDQLGIKKADQNPRVTEVIPEIIEMVKTLQDKGFAYETDDGIYYGISKFKDYGKLSGVKIDKQKTGTRVDTDKYEKEKAMDFALWKKAKEGEPSWGSPWGKGRPGWHIECSVMSKKFLGEQFDIHGGAVDLVFPHHENEIAQSEAATGKKPFVKYWLHGGFLNVEGEKMSKSLGNFIEIPELLAKYDPKVFRFFVSGVQYRSRIDFTEKSMGEVKENLDKFNNTIRNLLEIEDGNENRDIGKLIEETKNKFIEEMDDDFNTPAAWAVLNEFIRNVNKIYDEGNLGKKNAEKIIEFLRELDSVFGVFTFETEKEDLEPELAALIEEREKARKEKDWKRADEIREKLMAKGIILNDTSAGVKWRKA